MIGIHRLYINNDKIDCKFLIRKLSSFTRLHKISSSSSLSLLFSSNCLSISKRRISSTSILSSTSLSYDEEVISRWSSFKTNTNTAISIMNNDDTMSRIKTTEMMKG
jgi:hypothetical protein